MRNMQSELWCRLTVDLEKYGYLDGNLYDQCETPRMVEIDKAYTEMCEKFEAILDPDQRGIFNQLMNLATDVHWCNHEVGMAAGFAIARAMQKILDDPVVAFQQACATYNSAEVWYKSYKEELESYLEKRRHRPRAKP